MDTQSKVLQVYRVLRGAGGASGHIRLGSTRTGLSLYARGLDAGQSVRVLLVEHNSVKELAAARVDTKGALRIEADCLWESEAPFAIFVADAMGRVVLEGGDPKAGETALSQQRSRLHAFLDRSSRISAVRATSHRALETPLTILPKPEPKESHGRGTLKQDVAAAKDKAPEPVQETLLESSGIYDGKHMEDDETEAIRMLAFDMAKEQPKPPVKRMTPLPPNPIVAPTLKLHFGEGAQPVALTDVSEQAAPLLDTPPYAAPTVASEKAAPMPAAPSPDVLPSAQAQPASQQAAPMLIMPPVTKPPLPRPLPLGITVPALDRPRGIALDPMGCRDLAQPPEPKRPCMALPRLVWGEGILPLKPYFEGQPLCTPIELAGWRFVRVPVCRDRSCFYIGIYPVNGVVKRIGYLVPGYEDAPPPPALKGYRWLSGGDGQGFWCLWQRVDASAVELGERLVESYKI